jgi:ubiquitin C-terminal hydrolase
MAGTSCSDDEKNKSAAKSQHQSQALLCTKSEHRFVSGIPNYGQTCFLNSVLQALASLEGFIDYLKLVVSSRESQTASSSMSTVLSETLLNLLREINGFDCKISQQRRVKTTIDPRPILQTVCSENVNFQAKFYYIGKEQQDAQELLQAISNILVRESNIELPMTSLCIMSQIQNFEHKNDDIVTLVDDFHRRRRQCKEKQPKMQTIETSKPKTNTNTETVQPPLLDVHLSMTCYRDVHNSTQMFLTSSSGGSSPKSTIVLPSVMNGLHGITASALTVEKDIHHDQQQDQLSSTCSSLSTHGGRLASSPAQEISSSFCSKTPATRAIHSKLTPISPSPLSGWYGSAILCKNCQHVRPIQNTQFFDLPIVPTEISQLLAGAILPAEQQQRCKPCNLEDCLRNFCKVDHVHDVECRNCTIQAAIRDKTSEKNLLQETISALSARRRKERVHIVDGNSMLEDESDDEFKDLKAELVAVESCLNHLLRASPDDERPIAFAEESFVLNGEDEYRAEVPSSNKYFRTHRALACKCLFLTRLPAILAMHVQRRYYNPATGRTSKTFQHVIFPEILDVSPFCAFSSPNNADGSPLEISSFAGSTRSPSFTASLRPTGIYYRLMSVIEHRGGAEGGHYVCFRHDDSNNHWLFCSDDVVKSCDWNIVKQAQAYMLFYEAL